MSTTDAVLKQYMKNEDVVRDIIRCAVPDLRVGELQELNPEEIAVLFGDSSVPKKKDRLADISRLRDIFQSAHVLTATDGSKDFVLIGFENQSYVDYAMPVRVLVENALNYAWQVARIRAGHANEKRQKGEPVERPTHWLSGLEQCDRLRPVITIVIFWSDHRWTGPRRLQDLIEMPASLDSSLVDDNKLIIVEPQALTEAQIESCDSSLRQVLKYIRSSSDQEKLSQVLKEDKGFTQLDVEAANVIIAITGTKLPQLEKHTEGGKTNMCQAIMDMLKDARQAGRQENENELLEARREAQEARQGMEEARQSMKEAALRMRDAEFPIHQIATLLNQPERLICEWLG